MPDNVQAMTDTMFIARLMTGERTWIEVKVTGSDLTYDTESGRIISGQIDEVALSDYLQIGKKPLLLSAEQLSGVDMQARQLAKLFGDPMWNDAKHMIDLFGKFQSLHEAISYSFFSKPKSYTNATDYADRITGSEFNDLIDGRGGDDNLLGGKGNDTLLGGAGNDRLDGGVGNNLMIDTEGRNLFIGGKGRDVMRGGEGNDRFLGNQGDDVIYGAGGYDVAFGALGRDSFVFNAKDPGVLSIRDFDASDVLVNLLTGSAEEAYKDFMEHAKQLGHNVFYENGEIEVILKNVDLKTLDVKNFADYSSVAESGLF